MKFTQLVTSVVYSNISDGLHFFVDCLLFNIEHEEFTSSQPYCVLEKDGIRLLLFQDKAIAATHYPELRIVIREIEEEYRKVSASHPQFLHPALNTITLRPWGAREFAISDKQTGIRFQQW